MGCFGGFLSLLDRLGIRYGALTDGLAGVHRGCRLEEHDVHLGCSHRLVLDASGNNEEFARSKRYHLVAQVNLQLALQYQEEFVFMGVLVPVEST